MAFRLWRLWQRTGESAKRTGVPVKPGPRSGRTCYYAEGLHPTSTVHPLAEAKQAPNTWAKRWTNVMSLLLQFVSPVSPNVYPIARITNGKDRSPKSEELEAKRSRGFGRGCSGDN